MNEGLSAAAAEPNGTPVVRVSSLARLFPYPLSTVLPVCASLLPCFLSEDAKDSLPLLVACSLASSL